MKTIKPPFKVKATMEQIEELSSHLHTKSLTKILQYFSKHMKFDGPFVANNISNMIELSAILDKKHGLKIQDKYILAQAPINTRSPLIRDAYFAYINAIFKNKKCDYRLFINTKKLASTQKDLLQAEDEVKKISLYLWLSYKLPEIFIDGEKAFNSRKVVNKYCEDSLRLNLSYLSRPAKRHFTKRDDKNGQNKPFRRKRKKEDENSSKNRSASNRKKHSMRKREY
jgi:ATP-dependent RNA helicase SUPV3L1/SUV3